MENVALGQTVPIDTLSSVLERATLYFGPLGLFLAYSLEICTRGLAKIACL